MNETDQINKLMTDTLAAADAGTQPAHEPRERMLSNIKSRLHAAAPEGSYTIPARDDWEPFDEGVDRRVLLRDDKTGIETVLYRLAPGAKFASHPHTEQETCWVVHGDIQVGGSHVVHAGEMHVAEAGFVHPEILARTEALLLIRSQINIGPLTPA